MIISNFAKVRKFKVINAETKIFGNHLSNSGINYPKRFSRTWHTNHHSSSERIDIDPPFIIFLFNFIISLNIFYIISIIIFCFIFIIISFIISFIISTIFFLNSFYFITLFLFLSSSFLLLFVTFCFISALKQQSATV